MDLQLLQDKINEMKRIADEIDAARCRKGMRPESIGALNTVRGGARQGRANAVDIEQNHIQANEKSNGIDVDGPSQNINCGLKLGDVLWAKVRGFPPWPAIVVTREHAADGSPILKRKTPDGIPVIYFGTYERQILKPADATNFRNGIENGYHASTPKKKRAFALSICEVAVCTWGRGRFLKE